MWRSCSHTFKHSCIDVIALLYKVCIYAPCFSVSPIDCGSPTPPSGLTVLEPHTTTVSSVIVYQCQQPGFTPSPPDSVCGENGMWSPDTSQVVCSVAQPATGTKRTVTAVMFFFCLSQICALLTYTAILPIAKKKTL